MLWNREREACQTGLTRKCLRAVHNVDNWLRRVYSIRRGGRSAEFWRRQRCLSRHTLGQHLRQIFDGPLVFSRLSYVSGMLRHCYPSAIWGRFLKFAGVCRKLPARGSADCSLLRVTSVDIFPNRSCRGLMRGLIRECVSNIVNHRRVCNAGMA
jgi:hypothetical protein